MFREVVFLFWLLCGLAGLWGCERCDPELPGVFQASAWAGQPGVVADSSRYALPGAVVAADLDLDGDLDIAGVGPDRILWFENKDAAPSSFLLRTIDVMGCANGLAVLDMDGDGLPDLISAGGGPPDGRTMPGLLYWWRNPGKGETSWERRVLDPLPGNFLHDLLIVDLNKDGKEEIVAPRGAAYLDSDKTHNGIRVYMRVEEGGETIWNRVALKNEEGLIRPEDFGLAAGDFNQDGFADLVQFQTVWFNPQGALAVPWTGHTWSSDVYPSNLVAADMDQNGETDLVFSEGHSHRIGSSRVGIWFNHSGGGEPIKGTVEILEKVPMDPENLAVADLDANGVLDILTGAMNWRAPPGDVKNPSWNDQDGTLFIFAGCSLGSGDYAWYGREVRSDIAALHHLVMADLDGDGDLDVLGENAGAQPPPAVRVPSVQILWNPFR
jgi:hypothetical protein